MKKIIGLMNVMRIFGLSSAFVLAAGAGLAYADYDLAAENHLTGPNSINETIINDDQEIDIEIENDSDIDNNIDLVVETGFNDVKFNTVVDSLETGDIEMDINFDNENNKLSELDLDLGSQFGGIDVSGVNNTTGPFSSNLNIFNIERELELEIENKSNIDNNVWIYANSGNNDVKFNTQVGDITTGDIDVSVDIKSIANSGIGSIDLGGWGNGGIDAEFENSITGPNSENINKLNLESEVDIEIENKSNIDNCFDIQANTGENNIKNNTIVGDITTGSVSISITGTNQAN